MNNKRKIVLFGCGNGGLNAFDYLQHSYDVVAFTDNNTKLHGSHIHNILVVPPKNLKNLDYDLIYISSMYINEISNQLLNDLNIDSGKIKYLDINILEGHKFNFFYELSFIAFLTMLVWIIVSALDYFIQ